MKNRCNWTLQC